MQAAIRSSNGLYGEFCAAQSQRTGIPSSRGLPTSCGYVIWQATAASNGIAADTLLFPAQSCRMHWLTMYPIIP